MSTNTLPRFVIKTISTQKIQTKKKYSPNKKNKKNTIFKRNTKNRNLMRKFSEVTSCKKSKKFYTLIFHKT